MKIRVKWKGSQNQRRALTIQIEPDATVDDVKREILARCLGTLEHHLEDDDAAVLQHNMVLSLNGKVWSGVVQGPVSLCVSVWVLVFQCGCWCFSVGVGVSVCIPSALKTI